MIRRNAVVNVILAKPLYDTMKTLCNATKTLYDSVEMLYDSAETRMIRRQKLDVSASSLFRAGFVT